MTAATTRPSSTRPSSSAATRSCASEQAAARAAGRWFGIGVALAVDPSVSNMGYVATALDPQFRAKPEYLPKSGAIDAATIRVDPLGRVTAILGTTPQGQGHQTVVSQIVATELGCRPEDVTVVDEMDTFTRFWSISSGTLLEPLRRRRHQRRRPRRAQAQGEAGRVRRASDGAARRPSSSSATARVRPKTRQGARRTPSRISPVARTGTPNRCPTAWSRGSRPRAVFGFTGSKAVDQDDCVNSSNTYGFIAEVMAVEVDPGDGGHQDPALRHRARRGHHHQSDDRARARSTAARSTASAARCSRSSQYDDDGQFLTGSFMDYLVPTAAEAPVIDIAHLESPSPLTPLGSKGLGESSSMTVPAVIANAVSDALVAARHPDHRAADDAHAALGADRARARRPPAP